MADSPPDADELASRFGLGTPAGPMTPVARGVMGRVWSLDTERGRWAVKSLFDWATVDGAETDVALQEAAAGAGVALPGPVRSPAGGVVETVARRRWRAYEWMELAPPPVVPVDPALAGAVGELLATLHRMALPAPAAISRWFTRQPPAERWSALLARADAEGAAWAPALAEAMPAIAELGRIAAHPAQEPTVLCHCDLIPDNVRPGPDGLVVLDWEHAGALPPGWELGYVLSAWCLAPDGGVDVDGACSLIRSYRQRSGMSREPALALFAAAASAWLDFAGGLVARALNGGDGEQGTFVLRNLRATLANPPARARLERLLDAF
jgi:aminoglycoside phosphotransferase (APT) family kinase protein